VLAALAKLDSILGIFYEVSSIPVFSVVRAFLLVVVVFSRESLHPMLDRQVPGREAKAADDDVGEVPPELASLLEERMAAKQAKDFARADEIRDLCAAAGYAIVDTKGGPSSLKKI